MFYFLPDLPSHLFFLFQLKANLRQLQCERDCEQTDHAAMLKEMQEKLNQTRLQCESYQKQVSFGFRGKVGGLPGGDSVDLLDSDVIFRPQEERTRT